MHQIKRKMNETDSRREYHYCQLFLYDYWNKYDRQQDKRKWYGTVYRWDKEKKETKKEIRYPNWKFQKVKHQWQKKPWSSKIIVRFNYRAMEMFHNF